MSHSLQQESSPRHNRSEESDILIVRVAEDLVIPRFLLVQEEDEEDLNDGDYDASMRLDELFGRRCTDLEFLRAYYRKLEKELP